MPNSSYGDTVNVVLEMSGQGQIAQADFGDRSLLTRVQVQAKRFVDVANRLLFVHLNERFTQRRFTLNLAVGTNEYALDASISSENLLWHSFFCTTSGNAVPLKNWDYREFRNAYPDDSIIPSSRPSYWILKPIESDAGGVTHKVMFYPAPDSNYTIEYQAKLNAQALSAYTDLILWPPEYEHALWLQGRVFLEQALGEGRAADVEKYALKALKSIESVGSAPIDQRQAIRPGMRILGVKRGMTQRINVYPISR